MSLRLIERLAGHYFKGTTVKVDSEIQFVTTTNPEIDSTGGGFIWKIKTAISSAWKLRDNTKGTDIITINTSTDTVVANNTSYTFSGFYTPTTATESASGIAEISTQAEVDTGTDDLRFVTPLKLNTYPRIPQAGTKAFGTFALSGGSMKSTVTMPVAYADTDYVPMVIGRGVDNYNITVESITTTTFVINLNSIVAPTDGFLWTTTKF